MTFHFWSWHSCHSFRSELHASNDRTMAPVIHPISNINIINGEYIKIAPTSSNVDISCMQTIDIIAIAQRVTSTCGFVVFHIFFFFALFLPDPHQWLPCTLLFYVSNVFFLFFCFHCISFVREVRTSWQLASSCWHTHSSVQLSSYGRHSSLLFNEL